VADTSIVFDLVARDRASSTMDKVKRNAGLLAGAVGLMALKFGKDSVAAFAEAEKAQGRLSDAFDKFPKLADTNIGRIQNLNKALAQKTKFDDDATASGQAVLAQFGVTGKQLEKLTPLMQDYAAKTGKDLPTAAADFGKAMLGQGRALKAVGLDFEDTGTKTGNLNALMAGMRTQVGGFAEKEGKTAAGQAAILKNQFGELQEEAGSHLVPVLMRVASALLAVIGFIQENKKVIVPLVAVLGTLGAVVWTIITAQKAWIAVQAALNVVMSANPIGIVIVAIAALVAGIVIAYKRSETFREIVDNAFRAIAASGKWMWENVLRPAFEGIVGAFKAVGKAAEFLWDKVLRPAFGFITDAWMTVVGVIIDGAAKAFGWIPGLGDKLKNARDKFHEFKDSVNAALDGIKDEDVVVRYELQAIGVGPLANKQVPAGGGTSHTGHSWSNPLLGTGGAGNINIKQRNSGTDGVNDALSRAGNKMSDMAPTFDRFGRPVSPYLISQRYAGPYPAHSGIDLAGPTGTPIRSAGPGRVSRVMALTTSYGKHVIVDHPGGWSTLYAHMNSLGVGVGDVVASGSQLGTRGDTGNSRGPHLHFEVRKNGATVNPESVMSFDRGGMLPTGLSLVHNGTGKPEPVGHDLVRGGNTYNIYGATDPEAVVRAIQTYERRNGSGWRA
jgi:murein DD-endopeptidase MepM/ murein hydrolase activator NlpD